MMKLMCTLLVLFTMLKTARAQNGGIGGSVRSVKLGPLVNAQIVVKQGGRIQGLAITDYDGYYHVNPLPAGNYEVEVTYQSQKEIISDVSVPYNGVVTVDVNFAKGGSSLKRVEVVSAPIYRIPLVDTRHGGRAFIRTYDQLEGSSISARPGRRRDREAARKNAAQRRSPGTATGSIRSLPEDVWHCNNAAGTLG